jgi:hypothetical protein
VLTGLSVVFPPLLVVAEGFRLALASRYAKRFLLRSSASTQLFAPLDSMIVSIEVIGSQVP